MAVTAPLSLRRADTDTPFTLFATLACFCHAAAAAYAMLLRFSLFLLPRFRHCFVFFFADATMLYATCCCRLYYAAADVTADAAAAFFADTSLFITAIMIANAAALLLSPLLPLRRRLRCRHAIFCHTPFLPLCCFDSRCHH